MSGKRMFEALGGTIKPADIGDCDMALNGFIHYAITNNGYIDSFLKESVDEFILPRTGIIALVDKATGFDLELERKRKEFIGKFVDWLIINYWGSEGQDDDSENQPIQDSKEVAK